MNEDFQTPERITFQHLWGSVKSVLNFEKGLPFTLWQFLIRPGKASQEYLFEDRKKYMDPIKFLFLAVAIGTYIMLNYIPATDFFPPDAFGEIDKGVEILEKLSQLLGKYYNILLFLNVPVYAFMSWLLFKQKGWYFTEHLAINAFLYGTVTYMMPLILIVPTAYRADATGVMSILISLYYLFAYKKIFEDDWFNSLAKGVLAIICASFLFFMFIFFVMGIVAGYQLAAEGALG